MATHILPSPVKEVGYRVAPPPVRPHDQQSEFDPGDALLVELDGVERTVVIGQVRVSQYWTLYTVRFYSENGQFLNHSRILGEKALIAAFRKYIWWLK